MDEPQLDLTPAPSQSAPIKAGVSVTAIAPEKSFQSIIDQNKEVWPTLKPEQVQNAATAYLDKYIHPLPEFGQLSDDQKNNFYTEFNKKYNVGHVGLDDNVVDNPLDKAVISAQRFGDLATLGIPARAFDAAHMGEGNTAETRDAQLSQFATDPGMYGDLYRTSQSPIVKGVGGMAGMFAGANGLVNQAEQSGLGMLASAGAMSNKFIAPIAKPILGTAGKAAMAIGSTGWNALNHGMSALRGEETPSQGFMGLGLDTAALGVGGKTRVGNMAAQGAAGGASSLLGNAIHGQPLDWNQAGQQAITQAGVGAAFHGGAHEKPSSKPPNSTGPSVRNLENSRSLGKYSPSNMEKLASGTKGKKVSANESNANVLQMAVKTKLAELNRFESVTPEKTLQARLTGLQRQHEKMSELANHPDTAPELRSRAKKIQANVKKKYLELAAEHQAKHGKASKKGKQPLEHVTRPEDIKALVGLVKEMRADGNTKQADVAMSRFTPESKAKVYDEVKRQEAHDKARLSQEKMGNKAINKANQKNQKRENTTLQADIKARSKSELAEKVAQEKELAAKHAEAVARHKALEAQANTIKNLKQKQALKDQMAQEKADGQERVKQLKALRADIAARTAEEANAEKSSEKQAKQGDLIGHAIKEASKTEPSKPDNKSVDHHDPDAADKKYYADMAKEAKEREAAQKKSAPASSSSSKKSALARKDFQSVAKMRETVREANKAGESVRIRYYAERTGETGEIEHKTLHEVKILEGKNGRETKWKGINLDGQDHHYIERNNKNSLTDSNIISVERTGEPVKFKRQVHPETGAAHPVDVETGEYIPQTYREGVKSSDIHSKIDLLRKLDSGEPVRPQDVLNVARQYDISAQKEVTAKMSPAERAKVYEDRTGDPC